MKILFLDFDGVLNSKTSFHAAHLAWQATGLPTKTEEYRWPLGHLCRENVVLLNEIVEKTGCKIVVSSSWRILATNEQLKKWLPLRGFKYPEAFIDQTGRDSKDARGGEIQDWLDSHLEVAAYVILDDDSEDIVGSYTTKKHPNNFVKTDFNSGLTVVEMEKAIKILNS